MTLRLPSLSLAALLSMPAAAAGPTLQACIDFGCANVQTVSLAQSDWQAVQLLFGKVQTPAAERLAVADAIARLEAAVGLRTGTWRDRARNWQRAGEPGELDCIAESTNTDLYLRLLADAGLLRWHRVVEREVRGLILVHWTAVLEQRDDGSRWAVDSWFRDNGRPPVIIPLAQWHDYEEPDS